MLEFGSWAYDSTQMKIAWWIPNDSNAGSAYIDFNDYLPSNEWRTDGENVNKSTHEGQVTITIFHKMFYYIY